MVVGLPFTSGYQKMMTIQHWTKWTVSEPPRKTHCLLSQLRPYNLPLFKILWQVPVPNLTVAVICFTIALPQKPK